MKPVLPLLVLGLLASIVTGREQAVAPEPASAVPARSPHTATAVQDLELNRLVRERRDRNFADLFATTSLATPEVRAFAAKPEPAPAPVHTPTPPAAPSAPPLPFAYLGRMVNGDRAIAYVLKGDQLYLAEAGVALGDEYRVEGVTDAAVHFVYVPLGTRQVLSFPIAEAN